MIPEAVMWAVGGTNTGGNRTSLYTHMSADISSTNRQVLLLLPHCIRQQYSGGHFCMYVIHTGPRFYSAVAA